MQDIFQPKIKWNTNKHKFHKAEKYILLEVEAQYEGTKWVNVDIIIGNIHHFHKRIEKNVYTLETLCEEQQSQSKCDSSSISPKTYFLLGNWIAAS